MLGHIFEQSDYLEWTEPCGEESAQTVGPFGETVPWLVECCCYQTAAGCISPPVASFGWRLLATLAH